MKLLTIPKAAKESGVPYGELRRLINAGLVPVITLPGGRRQYLYLETLAAILDGCAAPIKAPMTDGTSLESLGIPARSTRCRTATETAQDADKYLWMERYT